MRSRDLVLQLGRGRTEDKVRGRLAPPSFFEAWCPDSPHCELRRSGLGGLERSAESLASGAMEEEPPTIKRTILSRYAPRAIRGRQRIHGCSR